MAKYSDLTLGQIEALVNILGGELVVYKVIARMVTVKIMPKPVEATEWELYRHEKYQRSCDALYRHIPDHLLEKHLRETGLIDRAFSLESGLVRGWLTDPKTYPMQFNGYHIYLWGSVQDCYDGFRRVPYLTWDGERVVVQWHRMLPHLQMELDSSHPALLAKG